MPAIPSKRLAFECLELRRYLAGDIGGALGPTAALVDDVNTAASQSVVRDGRPRGVERGANLDFFVNDGNGDIEYWTTDGSAAGTMLVRAFTNHRFGRPPVVAGDLTYFVLPEPGPPTDSALQNDHKQLWVSDGTAKGTTPLIDLREWYGAGSELWEDKYDHEGRLLLQVDAGIHSASSHTLWKQDTPGAKPYRYSPAFHTSFTPSMHDLTKLTDWWYFLGGGHPDDRSQFGLWRTDPDTERTELVHPLPGREIGGAPSSLVLSGNRFFFLVVINDGSNRRQELWMSDGTTANTRVVEVPELVKTNHLLSDGKGSVYFLTGDTSQAQAWKTDGSANGTMPLDLQFDASHAQEELWVGLGWNANDVFVMYISRMRGSVVRHTTEIWQLRDGAFTRELEVEGFTTSHAKFGDSILFSASDGEPLWRFDTGTSRVEQYANARLLGTLRGEPVIHRSDNTLNNLDAKSGALEPFAALSMPTASARPHALTPTRDGLYYISQHDGRVRVVSSTGPARMLPAQEGLTRDWMNPAHLHRLRTVMHPVGDQLLVFGEEDLFGYDTVNGSWEKITAGLSLPGPDRSYIPQYSVAKGHDGTYFLRLTENTLELWKTDGTSEGTRRLAGDKGSANQLAVLDDKIFFPSFKRLWISDGTREGTTSIDLPNIQRLVAFAGAIYILRGNDGLSRLDLESKGTQPIHRPSDAQFIAAEMVATDRYLYLLDRDAGLWRSDGTPEGTVLVRQFEVTNQPRHLAAAGDLLFFSLDDGVHGRELWMSDGTSAGTQLAADIRSGPAGSHPEEISAWNDRLYFSADDGLHGHELWSVELPISGDVDRDGDVDFGDFLRLAANFGRTDASREDGDLDGDRHVSMEDYLILAENFGRSRQNSLATT